MKKGFSAGKRYFSRSQGIWKKNPHNVGGKEA
jgi:hypothetical protein